MPILAWNMPESCLILDRFQAPLYSALHSARNNYADKTKKNEAVHAIQNSYISIYVVF